MAQDTLNQTIKFSCRPDPTSPDPIRPQMTQPGHDKLIAKLKLNRIQQSFKHKLPSNKNMQAKQCDETLNLRYQAIYFMQTN